MTKLFYVSQEEYDRIAKEEPEKLAWHRVRPMAIGRDFFMNVNTSSTSSILYRERQRKAMKKMKRREKQK